MTDYTHAPRGAQVEPAYVNVYSVDKGAGVLEQLFVGLWVLVLYLPLDVFSPVRYLCIAVFILIMFRDHQRLLPLMVRCWPLFAVAIFGLVSVGWSPLPADALRQGILLFLTSFVVVIIGQRLTTLQALRVVMFAGMITTLASIPLMDRFHMGGLYQSKNYFAMHMLYCMLLSLISAMNEKEHAWIRLLALPFIPLCFVFLYMADSATALVFAVVGGAGLLGIKFLWAPITRINGLPVFVILLALALVLVGALLIMNLPNNTFAAKFLELVGKDATLTGRTALWEGARLVAEDHPLFGVGLEGFWHYDSGAAQTLNENDYKPVGTKLTFHNAYWEVRVHLGLIGLALFIWFVIWTSARIVFLWLRDGSLVNSALLLLVIINITMTFTESALWGTFTVPVYVQALAGIAAFRLHEPRLEGRGKIVSRPSA